MRFFASGIVTLVLISSCLGCEPLPDGKECPQEGVVQYPGKKIAIRSNKPLIK